MPSRCDNVLRVFGPADERRRFLTTNRGCAKESPTHAAPRDNAEALPLSFNQAVPVPPWILTGADDFIQLCWYMIFWGADAEPRVVEVEDRDDVLLIVFETDGTPPVPWLRAVAKQFPKLTFDLENRGGGYAGLDRVRGDAHLCSEIWDCLYEYIGTGEGVETLRIPWGSYEEGWKLRPSFSCPDCGALPGRYHDFGCPREHTSR